MALTLIQRMATVSVNTSQKSGPGISPPTEATFDTLLRYLRDCRPVDLRDYHRGTLMRRVERRMHEIQVVGFDAYRRRLINDMGEQASLARRIFINHTQFFRDTAVWQELLLTLLPAMFSAKAADDPIRMWCAGCSTGEEAYSLAMLSAQILGDEEFRRRVRIMATDVDEYNLVHARAGCYRADKMDAISEDLRKTYFREVRGRYVFRADLRRNIVFGVHNLLTDPPFRRMDVVLCRNTLMYFNVHAQARVLNAFDFSLGPSGYLILGKPERPRDPCQFALSNSNHQCHIYSKAASVSAYACQHN
jgi:two-component system, chemotaxis family, CheB/CheR fusion protein